MKKKLVPCIIFIVIAVSITTVIFMLFGQNGNTADVNRVVGTSALYDKELINKAFDAVETKFATDFKGCTLTELRYDTEVETEFIAEMQQYKEINKRDFIIVLSNFKTDWRARDLGLIPNETYTDWSWSLVQVDERQGWEVVEGGWGY